MLIGNWTIDDLTFYESDLFKPMSNILSFDEENVFIVFGVENGLWVIEQIEQRKFRIIITSQSPMFSDTLKMNFYSDKINNLLKIKLYSRNMKMTCSKLLVNYDLQKPRIEEIIALTNK